MHSTDLARSPRRFSIWRRSGWRGVVSTLAVIAALTWLIAGRADRGGANAAGGVIDGLLGVAPIDRTAAYPTDLGQPEPIALDLKAECLATLRSGREYLDRFESMRAVFHKRERIDGELQELNVMDIKVRREPLSVHMRWRTPNEGRELIWQQEANDGQLMLHAGGWRGKLLPLLRLDPNGERALECSRRPISSIGVWSFHERLLNLVQDDLVADRITCTHTPGIALGSRACHVYLFEDPTPPAEPGHSRYQIYIDCETAVAIACEVYGQPEAAGAEPVLEESYAFNDLELGVEVTDLDFDINNPQYKFVKR